MSDGQLLEEMMEKQSPDVQLCGILGWVGQRGAKVSRNDPKEAGYLREEKEPGLLVS